MIVYAKVLLLSLTTNYFMPGEFPLNPQKLREYNIVKYRGVPPTWDLIQKTIKRSGLKFQNRFELVWGIPHKILTQVKRGDKELPCKYWHIFYDFDNIKKQTIEKIEVAKRVPAKSNVLETNKNILDGFKK